MKQDERNIYAIMKTMCLPGYHQSHGGDNREGTLFS